MKLIDSFPGLNEVMIEELALILLDKFKYPSLPQDYIDFLLKNNGGFVTPGYIQGSDIELHKEEVLFESPLKEGEGFWEPSIYAFFAVWLPNTMSKADVKNKNLPNLIASNQHSKIDYEILPEQMMSIASCTLPGAGDLLCISLDERDYGSIYFYFSQWYNPAFSRTMNYYEQKRNLILDKYNINVVEDHESTTDAKFEIDRIPFVKVANSFSEFLNNLKIQKRKD